MLNSNLYQVALQKHQDRLKEAEMERLYRQLKSNQPGLTQRVNRFFKAAGHWLMINIQPSPIEPCFDGS